MAYTTCECTWCHKTVPLGMVKMINIMYILLQYLKKKLHEDQTTMLVWGECLSDKPAEWGKCGQVHYLPVGPLVMI